MPSVTSYVCVLAVVVWTLPCAAEQLPLVVEPISAYCSVVHDPFVVSLSPVQVCVVPASMKIATSSASPTLMVPVAPELAAVPVAPAAFAPPMRTTGAPALAATW